MEDILIITSYYPPETGAASNRIFQLASGLQSKNFNVSVITPLPNYPYGKIFDDFKGKISRTATENDIDVHRLWIYASNSKNKFLRLIAMLSYSFSLIWFFIWNKIPDKVIVQSPPLLVAFTCMLCLKNKKRKVILNVSDLWPLAGLELGALKKNLSYKLLERVEYYNYQKADLILGQSQEILTHVKTTFPEKSTFLYRNYPNFKLPEITHQKAFDLKIKMVYAGLLGVAQGIYKLCQKLDYSKIEFHIYGAGSEQKKIEKYINENSNIPVFYHGEISREQIHKELIKYDLTIIPLLNRIYGSVPSKIFEYARLGIPILYFGGGEGERIIKENKLGWAAIAGDYNDLNSIINAISKSDLQNKNSIQKTALDKFDFSKQLMEFSKII